MKKQINAEFFMSVAVCLVPFVIALVFYDRLPEQMAIHFNFNGEPNSYASKSFAAFGIPFLFLCCHVAVWFLAELDPKNRNVSDVLKRLLKWLIPIVSVVIQSLSIAYAIGHTVNFNFVVLILLGVFFTLFGNYLPKCRQNYTVGIRLPWTLADEDNWNKTHRMAGYLWMIGGLVMFINAFINSGLIVAGVIIPIVAVPIIYSYKLHVGKRKDG